MDLVEIHADGSCLGNPGPGGWAAVLRFGEHRKELCGGFARTTNNRMEITAVLEGLRALSRPCRVTLYTDSQYVAKAITDRWVSNWQTNGWKTAGKKPVKNRDLWMELAELLQIHKVDFRWLKGHAGNLENERCDELARTAAQQDNLPPDTGFVE